VAGVRSLCVVGINHIVGRSAHLVAQTPSWDLFVYAKDLFFGAIMVLEKPSSLLIEHDGFIRFDERPLDRRLWQSVPLQYLIIEPHQHFELCERCLPKVLV
jgi:hypothetical protein